MRTVPPAYQTLFADLQQRLQWAETEPGSVYAQKNGKVYVKRRVGAAHVSEYLGPPNDPNTEMKVAAIKAANEQRRERRQLVQTLKAAGLPGPTLAMGHILEALAAGGLFNPPHGLVIVGTTAFATYAPLIGRIPAAQALITQDIDLALIELAVANDRPGGSIHAALERAGVDMRPEGAYTPPARLTGGGLTIEFLTSLRRGGEPVAQAPGLGVSAQALPFMDFLIADPIPIAVLHGPGVLARVPQPARYAVHKMLIANRRPAGDPKTRKDIDQARQIIEAMTASGQIGAVDDARAIAESRGAKWRRALEASERAMRNAIQ